MLGMFGGRTDENLREEAGSATVSFPHRMGMPGSSPTRYAMLAPYVGRTPVHLLRTFLREINQGWNQFCPPTFQNVVSDSKPFKSPLCTDEIREHLAPRIVRREVFWIQVASSNYHLSKSQGAFSR